MLKFNCFSCNQPFHIAFKDLHNKVTIQCPNCNNQLPLQAVASLRQFSESYMGVIGAPYHTNSHEREYL